jgi:hypothetical protein
MVPAFVKLLKDTEAEVRTAIAGQIPGMLPSHVVSSRPWAWANLVTRLLYSD